MRNSLILLLLYLFLPLSVSATEYYVATNGNDNNPGTLTQPWATWQKGFNSISAGDILYIRGGTYSPGGFADDNMFCAVAVDGKKGTSTNMFNVFAYPGETPILDCRNLTSASYERMGVLLYNCDYWHLSGLEITRCDQLSTGARYGGQGLMLMNSNYNKIERTTAHHNGGPGLGMRGNCEENLFLNCDAYSNWDAYSDLPGDNADGFDVGFITYRAGNDRKNYFDGCRAWMNGDDGFDMYQMSGYHGTYYFTNCWAWKQGYRPDGVTQGGNGCGFKYGDDNAYSADAQIRRSTHNCIAYANRTRGFSQETANDVMEFYNNISYNNGLQGFSFVTYNLADVLRNNISYKNGGDIFASNQIHDHNSWDSNVTVSDADFLSINGSELEGPRKSDGSLPDINFLHLASGSDLIDKGVNVGISFSGNAPDLGAFEVQSGAPAPAPVYTSSLIANASPSILEITYSLTLANIVPSVSSFSVLVNSVARAVNTVTISGTKVQLSLSSPIVYGDIVTVSYTLPSANPLQTSAGGQAVSIASQPVTNNVNTVIPAYVSSAVANATPSMLEITYNLTLANIVPAASSFSVLVKSVARTISTVAISGTKVQLTLASPVVYGDVITISYTKPSANPIQTSAGGQAISVASQPVTNNVNAVIPAYVSSAVANATPSLLEITYNLTLANIVPAASSFSVLVNSVARTISTVAISGTKVQLTLASPVVYGDVVTVSYTKPSTNPLQTSGGGQAISVASQPVTNNVNAVIPAYVSSAVANATPSLLEITYNLTLANIVPATTSFSVLVNSVARTISTVAISGVKVQLTLATPLVYGDAVTVSYTKPSSNPLQATSGGQAVTIGAQKVINNVIGVSPVYVSSAVANATPSLLEMTYNLALANIVPAATSFSVLVNSAARTVVAVVISGTKVQLTLASPVVYGDIVTVSYSRPSSNALQTTAGGQAATISAQPVTNSVNGINPGYVSSVIANATPSLLEITYNLALANIIPAASSFSVLVNSTARTITTVVISGSKVQLTLSSPVVYGNIVTVAYTKPSANPLQTTSGGQALSISAQPVTNNVIGLIPVYVSSAVSNATPTLLEMTYNQTLANIVPAASSFSVIVNSVSRTVNSVIISGTRVQLTLASRIVSGDIVTVSYVKPSATPIQTTSGGTAAAISNQPVINNCIDIAPTATITSPAVNSSFTSPANITITASASDADGSVSLVEFYNGSTRLGSASVAPYSFSWNNVASGNYSLTVIATDNQNTKTTSSAVTISVTNSTHASNRHPIIRIFNPRKGITYDNITTVEIDADASDPDGTISKVEFYNGKTQLVELTSPPYSYTWKDVPAGSYSITAIATDNSGDTTLSSPVEFVVGGKVKYNANSDIINLYPNPNNGHFSIDFINPLQNDKSEIIITDMSGKQVYDGPVLKEEITKQFDLSSASAGIYVMMIRDKDILVTKKFIKNSQ
jgi:uncharacterized repeat protein (TIGR02059 family)